MTLEKEQKKAGTNEPVQGGQKGGKNGQCPNAKIGCVTQCHLVFAVVLLSACPKRRGAVQDNYVTLTLTFRKNESF